MASILDKVKTGRKERPDFVIVHGVDGVGKTTFAAGAPSPLIIGPEDGAGTLDTPALETKSFAETTDVIRALLVDSRDYKTVVLDSLDWIENQLFAEICSETGVSNIQLAFGGYGKGYDEALRRWNDFIRLVKDLREKKNMNVVGIAHSFIKKFNDPVLNIEYDRYVLKMHDKAAGLWREAADAVLFANYRTYSKEEKGRPGKAKAISDDSRALFTRRTAAYDAKNRFGLPASITFDMVNGWRRYQEEKLKGQPNSLGQVKKDITELFEMLAKDDPVREAVVNHLKEIGDDLVSLNETRNRLREITNQKE